jgi:DegV family protein with EDD domain
MLSDDYDGKVQDVNNQRISVTQKQSVLDAIKLAQDGKSAAEIKEILETEKLEASIYITVDTLTYLKRGGRITPAAAALGTLLKIKPVLQIQGDKLDAFAKARTMKQAKSMMTEAMKKDFHERFNDNTDGELMLYVVHSDSPEAANEYKEELAEVFPGMDIEIAQLSLSVACHIGPGALALACAKKVK